MLVTRPLQQWKVWRACLLYRAVSFLCHLLFCFTFRTVPLSCCLPLLLQCLPSVALSFVTLSLCRLLRYLSPPLLPLSSIVVSSFSAAIFLLCCCVFLICPLIFLWFCVFLFCPLYLPPLLLCHPPTLLHLCLLSIFVSSSVAASSSSASESSLDIAESLSSVDACFFLSCYIFHICCWIFPFCYYVLKSNPVHFSSTFVLVFSNLLLNVKYFDGLLQP